ncbi:Uncharacterised protein [Avibacterium paragallinarum]|uniref:Uncharacterized protein n=1 Tax=Avibacterium paragallinarum TaxID=728 RepID=A0A377IDB7_AVIPA|nr:hypothetical protein [Avibacterium paragallinarum]STO73030.1 Uncharacterised protein [Avibacterium paragallinarum]
MLFAIVRDLFAYSILLSSLFLLSYIGKFGVNMQQLIILLTPALFVMFNITIQRKFKQDLDRFAYFSAILALLYCRTRLIQPVRINFSRV